jgi:hypothetical protein
MEAFIQSGEPLDHLNKTRVKKITPTIWPGFQPFPLIIASFIRAYIQPSDSKMEEFAQTNSQ